MVSSFVQVVKNGIYRPFDARIRRSRIAIARPSPVGCSTTTSAKPNSSAFLSAAYKSRANSSMLFGAASRLTPVGVTRREGAINPCQATGI